MTLPYASIPKKDPSLNMLDIYMPKKGSNSPVLIWIHGGQWSYGDKEEVLLKAEYFTSKGFAFVAINFRLSPKVSHPVHVQDVANAIMWVYANAKHYSADQKKIFLMGHSSGAHLASLVSIDEKYLKLAGGTTSIIRGVITLDGIGYDIPLAMDDATNRLKEWYVQAFGNSRWDWSQASPSNYVNTNDHIPPFILVYSGDDEFTDTEVKSFYRKLLDVKVPCKIFQFAKKNSASLNKELGKDDDKPTEEVLRFLLERL